jgi:enamine deaminase RidA (YjgF/YER057c/UK114 family)
VSAEQRLLELGIVLPTPAAPVANYVPVTQAGSLLVISGQLAIEPDGKLHARHKGKLGLDVSDEAGRAAARLCAINVLAQARGVLGSLDRIKRCLRLGGFINSTTDYPALALVMNGASDLMVEVLGEAGRHARSTIGVAQLPLGCAVEVEAMFEID